jgi:hypothetical protein
MTPEQIAQVEREQSASLPDSYRKFLEFCGNSENGVLESQDVYFGDLCGIKADAIESLREADSEVSLDGYIVFMMHQGYIFYCMRAGVSDPPVYGYSSMEGEGLRSIGVTFSEFIENVLSEGL